VQDRNRFFRPASNAQIKQLEVKTGISLPPFYKNYLLKANGGEPESYMGFVLPELEEPVMLGALYGISEESGNSLTVQRWIAECR
jgi:hypothetical protein